MVTWCCSSIITANQIRAGTEHLFNYSAFSHSQGSQYFDKQHIIVTLRALHFPQPAAVSFKLFPFFPPICLRGGMSYLALLPLDSREDGGKKKWSLLLGFKEGLSQTEFLQAFLKSLSSPLCPSQKLGIFLFACIQQKPLRINV